MSPSRCCDVGSPTRQRSGTRPCASIQSSIIVVPKVAGPSSSPVMMKLRRPTSGPLLRWRAVAAIMAASAPFMSAAPRPTMKPSFTSAANGSSLQPARSPAGTTSLWPAKAKCGPGLPASVAKRLSTGPSGSWPKGRRVQAKPRPVSARSSTSSAPSSAGVTLGQRISSWVRATGSGAFITRLCAFPWPPGQDRRQCAARWRRDRFRRRAIWSAYRRGCPWAWRSAG